MSEKLQTHHSKEMKQCYYIHVNTLKTKVSTNFLLAKFIVLPTCSHFTPEPGMVMTERKRGQD